MRIIGLCDYMCVFEAMFLTYHDFIFVITLMLLVFKSSGETLE